MLVVVSTSFSAVSSTSLVPSGGAATISTWLRRGAGIRPGEHAALITRRRAYDELLHLAAPTSGLAGRNAATHLHLR
jgi:hypothetical protein